MTEGGYFRGKSILVTGAGGSIGSALCERLVCLGAKRLVLLSLTESALYNVERRLRGRGTKLVPVLGSVLDSELMAQVVGTADIVIHAAAHKHVPICENNPLEAIRNNVIGTYRLAMATAAAIVPAFLLISTDKAVQPTSIMGATKRVAELLVRALIIPSSATSFLIVRFGNVLDSAGSVLPLWREQIAAGGPVTVTHPDCTRFFMSIENAVDLILGTLAMRPRDGTFVFDMGKPRNLLEMARALILEAGFDVPIEITGLRPGEKLAEQLHHGGEIQFTQHPRIHRVDDVAPALPPGLLLQLLSAIDRRDDLTAVDLLRQVAA